MGNLQKNLPVVAVVVGLAILVGMNFYKAIPPGHVGVATLFGNVMPDGYAQGRIFPSIRCTAGHSLTHAKRHTSNRQTYRLRTSCRPNLTSVCNTESMDRWHRRFSWRPATNSQRFVST